MIHDNCTRTKSESSELPEITEKGFITLKTFPLAVPQSSELPEIAENGFIVVSDFFAHQHESIEAGLKNSEFQYLIAFHPDPPPELWRLVGGFRVYVAPDHLKAAREFCMFIEFISSPNCNS